MRAVMIMFDSLNRHFLSCYGNRNPWVKTPNFDRLASKTIQFNNAFCGSMPCMPARRELHTGRPNFLESNWCTLQPFDDSMPELLSRAGVQTHLCTDHYHYFEDLGSGYHQRYNTYEFFRGQEGDQWIGQAAAPHIPENINGKGRPQDWINRKYITDYESQSGVQTFNAGIEYIRRNMNDDQWFLQIEAFDPHEPFFFDDSFKKVYEEHYKNYDGPLFDWPGYCPVGDETPEQIEHLRHNYAALLAQCDFQLGRILDIFDTYDLWDDTMLILNTDHGHFLGERDVFAKNYMPWWVELSHLPFFIWDPRLGIAGETRGSFVQTIDIAPTLMDAFGLKPTPDMIGVPLTQVLKDDTGGRDAGIFGNYGNHINVTDGRYVYMRCSPYEDNGPLKEYTLCPVRIRNFQNAGQDANYQLIDPLPHSKNMPVLEIDIPARGGHHRRYGNLLYDMKNDPYQQTPLNDPTIENRMIELMKSQMALCNSPSFQYQRMGFEPRD